MCTVKLKMMKPVYKFHLGSPLLWHKDEKLVIIGISVGGLGPCAKNSNWTVCTIKLKMMKPFNKFTSFRWQSQYTITLGGF